MPEYIVKNGRFLVILTFLSLCSVQTTALGSERIIKIEVSDGFELVADYYPGRVGGPAALILHQCTPGHGRSDWTGVAQNLHRAGVTVLNVDQRGFGDSVNDEFDTLRGDQMRGQSQAWLTRDAPVVLDHFVAMAEKPFSRLAFVGSSCGGAMNVINSTRYRGDKIAAYLSPALLDIWITPEIWSRIPELGLNASLYITSTEDPFAADASRRMFQLDQAPVSELMVIKGNAHAIALFVTSPTLEGHMIAWLVENLNE
jgi:hypothetical protein